MNLRAGVEATIAGPPPWPALTDEEWFWAHTEGRRSIPDLADALPGMPPPDVQQRFTGGTGDDTLAEGFAAYRLFKDLHAQHAGRPLGNVLEFGCGWGRILRFWLRECPPDRLVGVDSSAAVLKHARRAGAPYRLMECEPLPPVELDDERFDVVYAYSVFSHLPEATHLAWLPELRRLLRPGGLLLATTFPRSFIESYARLRADPARRTQPGWIHETFGDTTYWLDRYDRGDFCFVGHPTSEHFGDACIPQQYVEAVWEEWFDVLEYISDQVRCPQNVVVARNRGRPACL